MTRLNNDIVSQARRWVGTPYVHQASRIGAGCDCLGLVRGVWRGVLGSEPTPVPAYTADWSEAAGLETLWAAASAHMEEKPVADACAGDVILFRMHGSAIAKHLGILATTGQYPSFIHAYSGHGVVESTLSTPWARRIVACFAFPERTS